MYKIRTVHLTHQILRSCVCLSALSAADFPPSSLKSGPLCSTFRNSTADQATVWLWLGTFKKRMINRFLIACKRVTGLGRLPSVLIAVWSGGAAAERWCWTDPRPAWIPLWLVCLSAYYGNLACCISTTPLLLIMLIWAKHFTLFHNRTWLHMKIMFSETWTPPKTSKCPQKMPHAIRFSTVGAPSDLGELFADEWCHELARRFTQNKHNSSKLKSTQVNNGVWRSA